jgi:hypothetical protein
VDLDRRATAVLTGQAKAQDPSELLRLGHFCLEQKKHPAAAARLFADAFAADPAPADNRFAAARAAALAGCGQGDAATTDEATLARWRRQALAWLRADLALWQQKTGAAEGRAAAREALGSWQSAADLAGLRDPDGLARLPEAERAEWRRLWADVAALRKQVEAPTQGDTDE